MQSPSKLSFARIIGLSALVLVANDARPLSFANEPLFLNTPIKPNLMLVIDDSGSMDSEVLMPANDGALWWNTDDQSFVGRDAADEAADGVINYNNAGTANDTWKKYVYLFPIGTGTGNRIYGDSTHDHYAIPPRPEYGFARSAAYNKAFYDPFKDYLPWPSNYGTTFPDATPTAAQTDPARGTATLNLTANINDSNANWTFRLQPGMRNASGTVVTSAQNGTFNYYPATYYVTTDAAIGYDGTRNCSSPNAADYVAFVADPSILPSGVDGVAPDGKCLVRYEIKSGNSFPSGRSYDAEMQNFANWFTYHRKRHLGLRGGILNAFSDLGGFRAGLFTLNNRVASVSMLDFDTQKTDFLTTLQNFVGSGGTPTREALKHAGDQYSRTDGSAPIIEYCQKNFTVVFTDGFAVPSSIGGIGNEDGAEGAPYADDYSDTLGDIAMKFYRDNLRPDLLPTGGVAVSLACDSGTPNPMLDCNRNLHMVTLGVGLGVRGNIFGVTHETRRDAFDASLPAITWQEPSVSRNPVQVDDLYHATINGRGEMLNATTPDEIATKMRTVMETVFATIASSAATATNSTSLETDSQVFQARFSSGDWTGQLLALNIDLLGNIDTTPAWDAGQVIKSQSAASRTIITFGTDTGDGIPFTWSAISGETDGIQEAWLDTDAFGTVDSEGSDRVSFLRGNSITGYRTRSTTLGDIVNSSPFYVGPPRAGYPDPDYATFASAKSGRTPILYAGANDGMLHGFDATRCTPGGSGDDACTGGASPGAEKIAYVPGPVYPHLSNLTDPSYGESILPHRYYVDGSPMGADVKLGSDWTTVLIGGLNAGGQGYYALDVTNPGSFSEANAADLVLWEFTDEADADLGYTFNQPPMNPETQQSPQIAKMNNGKWAVIVGNGYNNTEADGHASTTGHAALFVIFIEDGEDGTWDSGDYVKIDTGVGSLATPNGLATPLPQDIDGDGDVDLAYAGDLEGNLWKFDLTSTDSDDWTARLLFTAVDAASNTQPITTAPVVVPHPKGGQMVSFGTGKYLETGDTSDTSDQTFYGIWDDEPAGAVNLVTGRGQLVEQEVLAVVNVSGINYRITSDNPVDYTTKRGWYMDLPTTGERVAYNPIARDLRTVFVTLIPNISDPCSSGGTGWIMELDYLTGGRLSVSPFDVNGDYAISDLDLVDFNSGDDDDEGPDQVPPSGAMLGIGIPTTPTVLTKDRETEVKVISGTSGQIGTLIEGRSVNAGRLSWRQIIGD